ncbi:glycoside hydrolase family 3 C-terminal domain-containing protein [Microbacterium sp. DT81.1]|uniref:glycoside hydrolase family 3 C-terminal domain-containing protein n=1 Tax=Microbacterium sp. DT81.1 TaxID=3393413 RepID=UPI003CF41FF8
MTIRNKGRGAVAASLTALLILSGGAFLAQPAAAAPTDPACPWTDPTKTPEERANLLLDASSVQQQMRWLNEAAANNIDDTVIPTAGGLGHPPGPPVTYPEHPECILFNADTDGPFGISYVLGSTAFPSPVSQASSWDTELIRERGDAMAEEAWDKQYNQIFAPGVDLVRHPWGGRGAEYLGEDPLLAGVLAGEWIESMRESNPGQPVASVLKHFVGNQQELDRAASSSNIDERTLHQLYTLPYEIAFEAEPAGVMCGFNQLNGIFACENPELLTTILRDQLQFEGFAVSDNGSQQSTAASLDAGLDQELSLPLYYTPPALEAALASGEITEEQIRLAAFRVLRAKFAAGIQDYELPPTGRDEDVRTPEHHATAMEIAEKGSVLLKNEDQTLPIQAEGQTIAVIGPTASDVPTAEGVSARTSCSAPLYGVPGAPPSIYECEGTSPLDAITARAAEDGNTVVFDNGSDLTAAAATAAAADVVVVFGYNTAGEFFDLPDLNLFSGGDALIEAVSAANENTVVVLETHGAVLLPWVESVPAVLQAWWPGQGGGDAIASLLFGDVNPSGKLPVTFPKTVDDLPTAGSDAQYPGVFADGSTVRAEGSTEIRQVNYTEGLQVGYKWYDEQGIEPLFEFGHGLSYTEFEYSKLKVKATADKATASGTATVSFAVKNTGDVAGAEIPQVYLTFPEAAGEPGKRLIGFDRIELAAGEERTVEVVVDSEARNHPLSIWDVDADAWRIVDGDYTVSVGSSSRDLPLQATMNLDANGPVATTLPSITGDPVLGKKLTANPGVWNEDGVTFSYQWLRNGEPISKATKAEYRVTKADQGTSLSVAVTAKPKSGPSGTATSAAVFVKTSAVVLAVPNKVVGTTTTEFTLSVRVTALAKGVTAEGEVTVVVDGKSFAGTLSGGKVTVPIGTFGRGIHPIKVSYGGSETVQPATGVSLITVRR